MQAKRTLLKIAMVISLTAFSGLAFQGLAVNAQTISKPQFFMTWSASNSFVPTNYHGKILPNQSSNISASFELVANGQLVNLSGQIIYWYLNDTLLGGGTGSQNIVFRPYGQAPTTATLKVTLPNYPGGELIHQITIPVVTPVAVAEALYPNNEFSTSQATLSAIPYFFNASSSAALSFSWSVNGQAVTSAENPQTLQITLPQSTPSGFNVDALLTIKDSQHGATASDNVNLIYQKQP